MMLKPWLDALLDLFFPPHCVGCGRMGAWLCHRCRVSLPRVTGAVCRVCGQPTPGLVECARCWGSSHAVASTRAPYYLEGTSRGLVHNLKYDGGKHLAPAMAHLMAEFWRLEHPDLTGPDCVVPVPLHPNRHRERGFNQAGLIGRCLARELGIEFRDDLVERVRDTPPQVGMSAKERRDNVRGAFVATGTEHVLDTVILVDDVTTTGATIDSCARALRKSGIGEVWGLAFARPRLEVH